MPCAACHETFHSAPPCLITCPACGKSVCSHCKEQDKEHGCLHLGGLGGGESDGLRSTEPPSDQEDDDEEGAVIEAVRQVAGAVRGKEAPEIPQAGLVRHRRYCTLHVRGDGQYKAACGLTFLHDDYEELDFYPAIARPLCRRKKCFG